jgi:parvulin-like peptidyl-prolyl isomerase
MRLCFLFATVFGLVVHGQTITIDDMAMPPLPPLPPLPPAIVIEDTSMPAPPPLPPIEDIHAPTAQTASAREALSFLPEILVTFGNKTAVTKGAIVAELGVGLNMAMHERREFNEDELRQIVRQVVKGMLSRKALLVVAGRNGFIPDLDTARQRLADQKVDLLGPMQQFGLSQEKLVRQVSEQVTINEWIAAKVRGNLSVEATEVDAFYQKNKRHFKQKEVRRLSQILINADPLSSPEAKADRRKLIEAAKVRLTGGADFATVARSVSECLFSADKGGDLGLIGTGMRSQAFELAAFELVNVGDVSDVVESAEGFHLIKLTSIHGGEPVPLEGVRSKLVDLIMEKKVSLAVEQIVEHELHTRKAKYHF